MFKELSNMSLRRFVLANLFLSVCTNLFADINECIENSHNCSQECRDTTSGFECICFSGYKMNENSTCEGKIYEIFILLMRANLFDAGRKVYIISFTRKVSAYNTFVQM